MCYKLYEWIPFRSQRSHFRWEFYKQLEWNEAVTRDERSVLWRLYKFFFFSCWVCALLCHHWFAGRRATTMELISRLNLSCQLACWLSCGIKEITTITFINRWWCSCVMGACLSMALIFTSISVNRKQNYGYEIFKWCSINCTLNKILLREMKIAKRRRHRRPVKLYSN